MDSKKLQQLNEARVFQLAGNAIMPLLEKRKTNYMQRLLSEFRAGSREYGHLVAQISVLDDIISEVNRKQQESEFIQEEYNNG